MAVWYLNSNILYYYGDDTSVMSKTSEGETTTYTFNEEESGTYLFSISSLQNVSITAFSNTGSNTVTGITTTDNTITIPKDNINGNIVVTFNSDTTYKTFNICTDTAGTDTVNVEFKISTESELESFENLTVNTGGGADTIKIDNEKFTNVVINSGAGADNITAKVASATIDAVGTGTDDNLADVITLNITTSAKISTGGGADTISVFGLANESEEYNAEVTINAGDGNNLITAGSETALYLLRKLQLLARARAQIQFQFMQEVQKLTRIRLIQRLII